MKLKNAYETFKMEPWLKEILYQVSQTSLAPNFNKWLERDVRSISFYQFSQLDLNSTYNLQLFNYDMTGEWERSIKFWTQYFIVLTNRYGEIVSMGVSDEVNGLPIEKRTTILEVIQKNTKEQFGCTTTIIAIVRRKILHSNSSDFGTLQSFDIFKFPDNWQAPA